MQRYKSIIKITLAILITGFSMLNAGDNSQYYLYAGNYTQDKNQGINVYIFDSNNGDLKLTKTEKDVINPSYLTLSPDNKYLYAVNETGEFKEKQLGGISAFSINPKDGSLSFINSMNSQGQHPCFITISNDGKFVLVSNYVGKTVAGFSVLENGALGESVSVVKHEGSGPNKKRQDAPHMHSIQLDDENKIAYAADLGSDKLYQYSFDSKTGKLEYLENSDFKLTSGSGPRHFEYNNTRDLIYVITELRNTIEVFNKNKPSESLQNISTLPAEFEGQSYCADIHMHPSAKFLYGSNRGHNSIVLFSIKENGLLEFADTFSVEGDWPRNFVIDPTGKYLLVANQKSNNISVFEINQDTGKLVFKSSIDTDESTVCLKFGNKL